ncbi:MAG TPA: ABC transporter ATP-binding protein [Gemmatimonadales bacterium]|nr:ABC transporter ATP-binding protein [Gemmatimonadales bacterium]
MTIALAVPSLLSTPAFVAGEPVVRVERLSKAFAPRRDWKDLLTKPFSRPAPVTVTDNVSFSVQRGEFFGLLGANGAGKTTIFRMLAARLLPDSGTATIDGCDIVRDPRGVRTRLTPVVTDERSLYWRLTAHDNMQLFASLYGVRGADTAPRIAQLLNAVELADTGNKMVGTFSSGMKQRLLIARALLGNPKVLLLDEPTRSLDPISARRFRQFLREELVAKQGCTVLLATHSAEEAFDLCDRVAILDHGRVLATGPVSRLMDQVRDDRYHVAVREHQAAAARQLLAICDSEVCLLPEIHTEGWVRFDLRIPGGPDGASELLASLTRAGVLVSHFQRLDLTLADLIERVVEQRTEAKDA